MAAKQKSGAQKRREKREREDGNKRELERVSRDWLSQPAYRGSGELFDENAPPVQLPIYGIPPATFVKAVTGAVNQLEQGWFYEPSILWDGMTRDDRVSASLVTRISGLLGMPLKLEPSSESDEAREERDRTEKRFSKIFPSPQLSQLLRYAIGLAVGVAQVKTTRTVKSWTPTIETWSPRYLWYDWTIRRYRMTTQNRGVIVIEPDDPEWIIYEPYGPQGWMHGALLRSLALPWIIRYWSRTWWSRHTEVHGQPIRVGVVPADRTPSDERTFLGQLSNLAHEAVIRLPAGKDGNRFDVKLIEAQANTWEGFHKIIEHCDRSIEIDILGQSMSTEGQGGLGAQDKAGESTLLRIIRGDALVGETLRERVLVPMCEANTGDGELAPTVTWQTDPPEDLEKKAKAFGVMAKGLTDLASVPQAMSIVDVRALLDQYQIPMIAEDEVEADPGEEAPTEQPPADLSATQEPGDAKPVDREGSMDDVATKATLAITPTDLASIVKVNEGRDSVGLPPLPDDVGNLFIRQQGAKLAAESAALMDNNGSNDEGNRGKEAGSDEGDGSGDAA